MRSNYLKTILKTAVLAVTTLLLAVGVSSAQVSLTAAPATATLPDGQVIPMWGYTCTGATTPNTCSALNPNAGAGWSPILITAPTGSTLSITLSNQLPAGVPTSLVIVGQLGGGLGAAPSRTPSPYHNPQGTTWPIPGSPDTNPPTTGDPTFTPPMQHDRVQSFGTEVLSGATTPSTSPLKWENLKAGTYLIESGTHPSIQGPMGLFGVLVVTDSSTNPATAYPAGTSPAVQYNADIPLLLSEIDPVQNKAVYIAVNTSGFSETAPWSGQPGACGDPTVHSCYPPAVNYDPRYYLINGVSFDKTNTTPSLFGPTTNVTGTVLVRFVNAGLRMHIPSIVGAQTGSSTSPSSGFSLIAEDGNVLPGTPRIQSEVFLAAGKTYDVLINALSGALPVFDRQLSLSTNNQRDGGMQAYIRTTSATPAYSFGASVTANPDTYYCTPGVAFSVNDPAKGVMANDIGVYGVTPVGTPAGVTLSADGTFTSASCPSSFSYTANNAASTALVTLATCDGTLVNGKACHGGAPTANADAYTSDVASLYKAASPGVLGNDTDPDGHPLTASAPSSVSGGTVTLNPDGSFIAIPACAASTCAGVASDVIFSYNAVNSQKTSSATPATVTVHFNAGSGLHVRVLDGPSTLPGNNPVALNDYRWIIEEDRTFQIDPACQVNSSPRPASCPPLPVPSLGTNFHSSNMPIVAQGCVGKAACESGQQVLDAGQHKAAVCDLDGTCNIGADQQVAVDPSQVYLDPAKHYYISVLPGDAANSFISGAGAPVDLGGGKSRPFSIALDCSSGPSGADFAPGTGTCGHTMGGAQIKPGQTSVDVKVEENPLPTAQIAVFVFEDDWPLNGENDTAGSAGNAAAQEPGLGGFEIVLFDQAGGFGDSTGQPTYDMFNMPLSNSLAGKIDPETGLDACPISPGSKDGLVGMIVTCPHFESDGRSVSPLEGQALISNLYPGLYEVMATPAADRIAKGEEWLQTNTLDGTKPHEAFIKAGEPAYFQEFGPAGYHVAIGFANPKIINARKTAVCAAAPGGCQNTISGTVTTARTSRTPDQRLYSSGSGAANSFTQCYVSLGDPTEQDFAFAKCDAEGKFTFDHIPDGTWRITIDDQWNDLLVDGLSTPVSVGPNKRSVQFDVPMQQWRTNLYTRTFFDQNGDGVSNIDADGNPTEPGLPLVPTNVRFRDGSFSNFNNTDLNGFAGFNEIFPIFNWMVLEADTTRYKQTGVHVVYDAGGPADGTPGGATSAIGDHIINTKESTPVPSNLRVPGAVYCADADCTADNLVTHPNGGGTGGSSGRIDPPWVTTEGWQGFIGNAEFVEFGKAPYADGENGGIKGHVIYMSTRPFDDPALLLQLSWTPGVPNVVVNLYQEGTAPDGTKSLKLVDTTKTSSWDAWAQGFRPDGVPNMNCPGQDTLSPFYFTLRNSRQWLNPGTALPNESRFKCYDGMALFNQVQPAPYDGMYQFPSIAGRDVTTGKPTGGTGKVTGSNCSICVANPVDGTPMLPAGKYVVEMVLPPGYELVKEEDKNILIGDNYIAPVAQQFGGLGNIFIMPDQAAVGSTYNPNNQQDPTNDLGVQPRHEGDTGSVETFWPCVGKSRVVPDFISLFPQSGEISPFAGATRNLCDRKEVTLEDQMQVLAKFYVFSSTHVAAHYTGIITDDLASEFDPFSPQFGEKFAVPNLPVAMRDFNGVEISRTYSDQWGAFNGLNYSTWEVNPPNPTGYAPTMMVACMNDPGPIPDPAHAGQWITDPLYNPAYSQFCYEWAFMPGQTAYMDTPVVPTSAFAEGYNLPDCAYPNATPAIARVTGDSANGGSGPWVSAAGHTLTITALGDQTVPNHAYSGPQATTAPYNQRFTTRHYGFGSTPGTVTIGGVPAALTGAGWGDLSIQVTVPANVPSCMIQQRGNGNGGALCGELEITTAPSAAYPRGQKSIDTVTVTVGGKTPKYINGENASNNAIQTAIDNATPGDLILVGPGTYNELLLMWKPVRLQGVGAASVTVNANVHPAGKLDGWRRQVNCLFGLSLDGAFISNRNPYDRSNVFSCSAAMRSKVDPIPGEPIIGGAFDLTGNLAELLQEPTLMGAYEGAGITVLGKGLKNIVVGTEGVTGDPLTNSNSDCNNNPSNFLCNPSRVDGLTFTNSSAGGGGIYLHGWNHFTEVSNNRVRSNVGTLTGGIVVGQLETIAGTITGGGQQEAYGYNTHVLVHNNSITQNAALGDALATSTPEAAGGVTICTGADNYKFNNNWVCGNLSGGDGGGFAHYGLSYNGTIANNWFLFNQSANPTVPAYGGGIAVLGASPVAGGLSDGTGPGLVIDSNLIMGNTAESGSGGGIHLQGVNGSEVARNSTNSGQWYDVTITNNIIADNVAGWDGGGVSMQDALAVRFINNTTVYNDSTGSAGVLFNTLGGSTATGTPPDAVVGTCNPPTPGATCTAPQPAGLVAMRNTAALIASLPSSTVRCPAGYGYGSGNTLNNGKCRSVSLPAVQNDLFWQNRSFHIEVGSKGSDLLNQQNLVKLVPTLNQSATGSCESGANYWDIGVRGDTGPSNHGSGFSLTPVRSILDNPGDYPANNNLGSSAGFNPAFVRRYCNGSKVPPENGGLGYDVPPGIADATLPNPVFNLTAAATVDEGNNWVNVAYGPLSLSDPAGTTTLGNYSILDSSPAVNAAADAGVDHDFFGTHRPQGGGFDIGAVESSGTGGGGGGGTPPPFPTLTVLDSFTRANATNLGSNWSQFTLLGAAALRVNTAQAMCNAACGAAPAEWNVTTFGAKQAAAFTFASAPAGTETLLLKVSGPSVLGIRPNAIEVQYSGGAVTVSTFINLSTSTIGSMSGTFASGDTMTAMADQNIVYVWKTSGATTTYLGSVTLPSNALWSAGGQIGMLLSANGSRVDNFAGGNVP